MDDEELIHAYDAAKARLYYLKTRHLKGRQAGVGKTLKGRPKAAPKRPAPTRAQRQAARRKKIEAQVEALKGRLERLRAVLAQEVDKAQARSGNKSSKKKAVAKKSTAKPLTNAQKLKAADAAEAYRKKNPDKFLADEVKSLNGKIKTIQERIAKMRKNGSVGARRTATK